MRDRLLAMVDIFNILSIIFVFKSLHYQKIFQNSLSEILKKYTKHQLIFCIRKLIDVIRNLILIFNLKRNCWQNIGLSIRWFLYLSKTCFWFLLYLKKIVLFRKVFLFPYQRKFTHIIYINKIKSNNAQKCQF